MQRNHRVHRFTIALLMVLASFVFSIGVQPTQAQAPTNNCVLTPGVLEGQGFNVTGLGFTVTGLGFNVTGLGFNVTGLGFTVTGLGLDPKQVATEIQNNTISNQWLADLLPGVEGASGYNSTPTAIIIVDDESHGAQVEAVFNALLTTGGYPSNVDVFRIVVGDSDGYDSDAVANELQSKVNQLKDAGYQHFIFNLSFGLIPCDDTVNVGGKNYPWNFEEMIEWVEAANESIPPQPVVPILSCVYSNGDGTFTAQFGYRNDNDTSVVIPIGNNNKFNRTPQNQGQPTLFESGRAWEAFSVRFSGSKLTWSLKGPDGVTRYASANPAVHGTKTQCGGFPAQTLTVRPQVCVADNGNGSYTARFSYASANKSTVIVPVGANNYFSPGSQNRGQATHFLTGVRPANVFSVDFDGSPLTWTVKSPNGNTRSVTATPSSPACISDSGYGTTEYLEKVLKVPAGQTDEFMDALFESANDDLSGLRALLRNYLNQSQNSGGEFQAFAVASAGNYKPWLGSAPLAPARWEETIAVSASVGNNGPLWQFSQNGNVIAPGVAFQFAANTKIAGTSFAAPFISMYLGSWLTYPNACTFPTVSGLVRPPLVAPDTLGNAGVSFNQPSEFTCSKPVDEEPEYEVCYAEYVVDYVPGIRKNGSAIPSPRKNPSKALGAPQNNDTVNFVALGLDDDETETLEGVLILEMSSLVYDLPGDDFRIWETTFGDKNRPWSKYPERVEVYASLTGDYEDWHYIGTTSDKDQAFSLGSAELYAARYFKLVDVTNPEGFPSDLDGFDVDAIEGFNCLPDDEGEYEEFDGTGELRGNKKASTLLPVARAGRDVVAVDKKGKGWKNVTLNGSASYDPDGKIASYVWTLPGYDIEPVQKPTVKLPAGTYEITLTVTDKRGNVSTDTVIVTVNSLVALPSGLGSRQP